MLYIFGQDHFPPLEVGSWSKTTLMVQTVGTLKGLSFKPSGNYIVAPIYFFWDRGIKFWLLAYFLIFFSCPKFQKDWTTFILGILQWSPLWIFGRLWENKQVAKIWCLYLKKKKSGQQCTFQKVWKIALWIVKVFCLKLLNLQIIDAV